MRFNKDTASEAWSTVVGVAGRRKKQWSLQGGGTGSITNSGRNLPGDWDRGGILDRTSVVVVRSSLPPDQTSRWIRSQVAALDPTLPVDVATLQQRVSKLADQPRFQTMLVGFFAATGLSACDHRSLWSDFFSGDAADAGDWCAHGAGGG